jgi:hypothetical protein
MKSASYISFCNLKWMPTVSLDKFCCFRDFHMSVLARKLYFKLLKTKVCARLKLEITISLTLYYKCVRYQLFSCKVTGCDVTTSAVCDAYVAQGDWAQCRIYA